MLPTIGRVHSSVWRYSLFLALATAIVVSGTTLFASRTPRTYFSLEAPLNSAVVEKIAVQHQKLAESVPLSGSSNAAQSVMAPQIARVGKVSLYVANVDRAVSELHALTTRNAGDVFSLELDNESDAAAHPNASVDLRIPASRFDATMQALQQIGKVRSRSIDAEDVTDDITDSSARLRNLRRTEADIAHIMDRSGSVDQVLNAETQLSQVREQIETLEADLKGLQRRVVYSTISVTLEAEGSAGQVEPTAFAQVGSALRNALHSVSQTTIGTVAALLWLAVYIPFVAAVMLALILAYRILRATVHRIVIGRRANSA